MGVIRIRRCAAIGALGQESRAADRCGANFPRANDSGRNPGNQGMRWYISRDHAARRYHCPFADSHSAKDRRVGADAGAPADSRGHQAPPRLGKQFAVLPYGRRVKVICKAGMRADKGAILDDHTARDERERQHFDIATQTHIALDLDERRDLAAIANNASIQIDELWVWDYYVSADLNVRRDQRPKLTRTLRRAGPVSYGASHQQSL